MKILLLFLFFLGVLITAPLMTIWSLNTLFGLGVGYTVKTWLAIFWLSLTTFGGVTTAINNLKK
jgi:hypothetical protein